MYFFINNAISKYSSKYGNFILDKNKSIIFLKEKKKSLFCFKEPSFFNESI